MLKTHVTKRFRENDVGRAISAVVGVSLMVVVVVLLASTIAGFVLTFDEELQDPEFGADRQTDELNPWSDGDALFAPRDPVAGTEDVRYRVRIEIKDSNMEGDSLNEVGVAVTTGDDMFGGTAQADIERFEVDKTDGTTADIESDVNGWVVQDGGGELQIQLSGSEYTDPSVGDVITVVFGGVDNPSDPDTYDVTVTLNEGEDVQDGSLEIIEATESLEIGVQPTA